MKFYETFSLFTNNYSPLPVVSEAWPVEAGAVPVLPPVDAAGVEGAPVPAVGGAAVPEAGGAPVAGGSAAGAGSAISGIPCCTRRK